ncbi:MAG TPA: SDR family NAD(P)-dependent oxidoreductase [Acidimicrobiia bacterium]|nr:SDR family NAD(P)-dependent oxidoreductase [Acidimicrobiia bacterium]
MTERLAGHSVLVTGAASGMGRSTTVRLVAEGATVTAVDRDEAGIEETVKLTDAADRVLACTADVSREADVVAAIDAAVEANTSLSGVVTCAGIFHPGDLKPAADVTLDDFLHVIGVNLAGTFLAIKYALPHLVEAGGSIVTIASTAAIRGHGFGSGYTASKGGVDALTRLVATQYGKQGVRANCICPGGIDTPMTAGRFLTPGATEVFEKRVPLARVGQPDEIAAVAAFLLSDDAAYLSGQTVAVDGGSTIAG